MLGDGPGIFPIRPFSLSRPIKSTYEEQSRKGPRHNLDLSPKTWWTFRIFSIFFSVRGAGKKEEASEEVAGGSVLIKNRGRVGGFRGGGVGGGRALGKCLWGGRGV